VNATTAGVCRRLLSSSVVCNTPRRNVTHKGAARGGPVVVRPVRATPYSQSPSRDDVDRVFHRNVRRRSFGVLDLSAFEIYYTVAKSTFSYTFTLMTY